MSQTRSSHRQKHVWENEEEKQEIFMRPQHTRSEAGECLRLLVCTCRGAKMDMVRVIESGGAGTIPYSRETRQGGARHARRVAARTTS
jgi:hypothetical protein